MGAHTKSKGNVWCFSAVRINEAKRLGFEHVVLPMKNYRQLAKEIKGIKLYGAETIGDALKMAMPRS